MNSTTQLPSAAERVAWLAGLGTFKYAVTLTFKGEAIHPAAARKATKLFVNRLSRVCFKHAYRRGRRKIPIVCSIEEGDLNGRIHAHLAIGSPTTSISFALFKLQILAVTKRIRLIGFVEITPYENERWLGYITKQGVESLELECCSRSQ
jgi:hypothetical protein